MSLGTAQDITVYVARVDGSGGLPSTGTVQFTYTVKLNKLVLISKASCGTYFPLKMEI